MNLTKPEKIQFVYDLAGSFFCALLSGLICVWLNNPSGRSPLSTGLNWETLCFSLSFGVYLAFFCLFWKSSYFKRFRLNFIWIFVNACGSLTVFFFFVFLKEIFNQRLFSGYSLINSLESFLLSLFIGSIISLAVLAAASCFWYSGFIHRTVSKKCNKLTHLNLKK